MSSAKQKDPSKNPLRYYSICSWIDPEDTRKFPQELCDLKGLLKLLQKKKSKGPVIATYNLILKNEVKEEPTEVELSCSTIPDTVKDLKEEIEEQYNIPMAMQSIQFHGELLEDEDSRLRRIGFRNRDTLEVSYTCEAEIQKVKRVLTWVDYLTAYLHNQHPLVSTELSTEAELLIMVGLNERLFERMANNYFSPPDNPRVKANKCYFSSNDGVAKLVNLLYIISDQPWGEHVIHLKLLESRLLDALRCFGNGDEKYVEELIKHDVPGFVVMMMTRFRLVVFRPVEDLMGSPGVKAHNDLLLLEVISSILEIMWTMRLKKEQYTDMTALHVCVENLVALTVSPSVTNRQACLALYIVLIRLCWIESIVDLGQASMVFLEAPKVRESFRESPDEVMVIKYFCATYVSWKLLHNVNHFKTPNAGVKTQIEKTYNLLKDFHATVDREKLKVMVDKYDLAMYVLLPMLGLLLHPKSQPHTMLPEYPTEYIKELEIMAFRCCLIHLEVGFTNPKVREGIKVKEIGEFLVCFAWGLPPSLRPYAQHLVNYVHSFKPLPIPKLSIIVRSRVARRYLEFDKLQKEKEGEGVLDQVAHPNIARVGLPLMTKDQHLYVIAIQ